MKSLKIYIVEDEPLIVSTIEVALLKQGFLVVGDAEDYDTALKDIERLKPDLVLVDIQLSGVKDGVDLALELDTRIQPYLFLSSQTDPQTIDRVKHTNPLGFIVKPFTETGLRTNIELAWHSYNDSHQHFLTIKQNGILHRINENTISYLKAYDNYCYVVTQTETHLVPHTLKYIFKQLQSDFFIKSHRSFVVNLKHILRIEKNNIILKNDTVPLSASQKSLVVSKLKSL